MKITREFLWNIAALILGGTLAEIMIQRDERRAARKVRDEENATP